MTKDVYKSIVTDKEKFARLSGLKTVTFDLLLTRIVTKISEHKEIHALSRRGKKSDITIANKLLLTVMYYRNYYTYLTVSEMFGMSEGYANKIFHKMSREMVKVLKLKNSKELSSETIKVVLIDASEQRIERPVRGQKKYYSGKKKSIR